MNNIEFVNAININVKEDAIKGTIQNLKRPPGRRISPEQRARSDWYNGLPQSEKKYVNDIISSAAHQSVFGFFAVLDGSRKIDPENGLFELAYVGKKRIIINDKDKIGLHEIFNSE